VDFFQAAPNCAIDTAQVYIANPDLGTAWHALLSTFSYTFESSGSVGDTTTKISFTFDANALESYKSACTTTVGIDDAMWIALPPTDFNCATLWDEFILTETNFGVCYPTTDACKEYGEGYAAIASFNIALLAIFGMTCTVSDAVTERIAPSEAVVPAAPTINGADVTIPAETTTATSESLASMITSFSVATVAAAAVGTVLYL
jgi:hypothetical protein